MIHNLRWAAFLLIFIGCATNPQGIEPAKEGIATVKAADETSEIVSDLDDAVALDLDEIDAVLRSDESSSSIPQALDTTPYWDVTQEPLLEQSIGP